MEDKINHFFLKYNGIGVDFDGVYGFQCMDLYQQYNKDVVGAPIIPSNAIDIINVYPKDFYEYVSNSPDNHPNLGDIVLWTSGIGINGHVAICFYADNNHFISFDQNYPTGSVSHFQNHNYQNVAGWLHPKALVTIPPVLPVITDQTKLTTNDDGEIEWGTIKSLLSDRKRDYTALEAKVNGYLQTIGDQAKQIESLKASSVTNVPIWSRRLFKDNV